MHHLGRLLSITISYSLIVALAGQIVTLAALYISRLRPKPKASRPIAILAGDRGDGITALHDFRYENVEPIKYRPFETRRHVAMGIKKAIKQDWIRIDRNYLNRMQLRKRLVDEYPTVCLGNSEISNVAIRELYEEVMLGLLPKRFPTIFQIKGDVFQNLVTGTQHSISAALVDHSNMLRQLATNVEEDFWLMVPNEQNEFILQGFVACFPQGLLPAAKVGMSVSEIHKPIPGYEGRLKKGVVRCFERMARGQSIARLNWSIQCNQDTLHLPYEGANTIKASDSPSQNHTFDPTASFLRVEHHTLTCLPRTGTIVFAVRSYLTPLTEIKSEGSGPTLADACESMPEKFGVYKNRPTWGVKLCEWLREGDDQAGEGERQGKHENEQRACPFGVQPELNGTCPIAQ